MATCDVTQLLADGRCFMCLNKHQAEVALAQLLCNTIAAATIPAEECSNLFQDPFDGPQGVELLVPPWEHAGDTFLYDTGTAIEDPGGDGSIAYVGASSGGSMSDGYAQAECSGTGVHGIRFRADPNVGLAFYVAEADQANDTVTLKRGSTVLASVSATFVSGAVLRIEAVGDVLTVIYDGVTLLVVRDDSGSKIAGPGLVGMSGSEDLGAVFDNFESCSWD